MMDRLNELITDVLEIGDDLESLTSDDPKWDSLAHLNLILALEEEFNIEIPHQDFPKLHKDYNAIFDYVKGKISA